LSADRGAGPRLPDLLAWAAVVVVAFVTLALVHYRARDPDSVLYARIAAELSRQPVDRWIAPTWPPGWYAQGLYREHPVGTFVLPALVARLGYPAEQAAYAVNAVFQALALVLIPWLAAAVVRGREARALAWTLQLLPIAFTYRIRANQEAALVVCLVGALLGTERSRHKPAWGLLTTGSLVCFLLVKGVLSLVGALACALWLLVHHRTSPSAGGRDRWAWGGLALALGAMALVALGYEIAYRKATGESFWLEYGGRQLGLAARPQSGELLIQKAYNLVWYLGRVLWFPFPWVFLALAAAWRWRSRLVAAVLGRPLEARSPEERGALAGLLLCLGLAALYVGLFSLSDRRADRYIFPVYYALGAAGAVAALRGCRAFDAFATRLDRWHPLTPVALFLITFALHILSGRVLHLPQVKIWGPDS
jgi:4-amino-4-deoxy-L-arabinose transferase-like glycosyltransferase